MPLGRLFGTDGVRGVANRDLTPELAFRLGRAAGALLAPTPGATILVGRDTRRSGPMLEAALAAGLASVGTRVGLLGIVPTPGVAHLTVALQAAGGAVISASHNPFGDNGIKFFAGDGFKLPDELEEAVEARLQATWGEGDGLPRPDGASVGTVEPLAGGEERYLAHLQEAAGVDLAGLRIVVDCAHGAAFRLAPRLLRSLGAAVEVLNDEPDGVNINVACGSTHPEGLCRAVAERGAHLGLAYDGDADRVVAADEKGNLVDGDQILAVCGLHFLRQGSLAKGTVACTGYSNLGLKRALEREGGRVLVTPAGDRHVLEGMRAHGLNLGGEQSGHVIFLDRATTGDGLLTTTQLLRVMREEGQPLSVLAAQMERVPQLLENVPVRDREGVRGNPRIEEILAEAQNRLGDEGRLLVRPSGTEPVVRVMGEASDPVLLKEVVGKVAQVIREELGG